MDVRSFSGNGAGRRVGRACRVSLGLCDLEYVSTNALGISMCPESAGVPAEANGEG